MKTEEIELQSLVHVCQNDGGRTENQKDLTELIWDANHTS